jgi:hypothetical protein
LTIVGQNLELVPNQRIGVGETGVRMEVPLLSGDDLEE